MLLSMLGFPPDQLSSDISSHYETFEIKAGRRGKVRTIHKPDTRLLPVQRAILQNLIGRISPHSAATAYFPGRSILANAQAHHLCAYLFKTDIHDFFASISAEMLRKALYDHLPALSAAGRDELCRLTMVNGGLPQGAPTSPALSNLALHRFDTAASNLLSPLRATYTRYADDIAVSAPDRARIVAAEAAIAVLLAEHGFRQHEGKTGIVGPGQAMIVTGLDVSCPIIRPTRAFRKKTAALIWLCKKYPRRYKKIGPIVAGRLAFWNDITPYDPDLRNLTNAFVEDRGPVDLEYGCFTPRVTSERQQPQRPSHPSGWYDDEY